MQTKKLDRFKRFFLENYKLCSWVPVWKLQFFFRFPHILNKNLLQKYWLILNFLLLFFLFLKLINQIYKLVSLYHWKVELERFNFMFLHHRKNCAATWWLRRSWKDEFIWITEILRIPPIMKGHCFYYCDILSLS